MKKHPRTIKIICAVTALIMVLGLTSCSCTSCSCGGLGSLGNLIGGGGGTTATVESSTEVTTIASETTTTKPAPTTAETTTKKADATSTTAETTTNHAHNWQDNGEIPATCTEDGSKRYICSICGAEYSEAIPALGHDWVRNGGSPPDCTEDGGKWYICTRCWEEYVEVLPAVGHDWDFVYHCDATCEDYGYDTFQCLRCGAVENMDYELYPPLGHDDYDIVGGAMGHTHCCSRCGHEFPETFSAHEWACLPDPDEPTLYHIYVCFMCGYVDHKSTHTMMDGSCTECGYSGPIG